METRSIHFKSDFLVRLMNEVDWSTPFSIRFFTTRAVSAKVVAFDGENYVGCTLDESTGALLVPFERFTEIYRQGLGTLRMELTYRLSNALYPDQYQDVVLPAQPVVCTNDDDEQFYLSLALTGDDDVEVSASVVAPFMTGPQGEQGEQGVGISTMVQTSASVASAGANVWKMTLTDGREFSFTVLNGEKGDTGATGPQGPQGAKGEKGDKGDTGARGPQGEQGPRGVPGQRGEKGAKGDRGDRGLTGESGPAGSTPLIGQNGNWWVGGTDTGVKADYSGTEAQRQATFEANEADRDQEFANKEATRDAANQAALDCAETLAALGPKIDEVDAQSKVTKSDETSYEIPTTSGRNIYYPTGETGLGWKAGDTIKYKVSDAYEGTKLAFVTYQDLAHTTYADKILASSTVVVIDQEYEFTLTTDAESLLVKTSNAGKVVISKGSTTYIYLQDVYEQIENVLDAADHIDEVETEVTTKSTEAKTIATNAYNAAVAAQSSASTAMADASSAQQSAADAEDAAEQAGASASQAASDAADAVEAAEDATELAQEAKTESSAALTTAQSAVSTANSAAQEVATLAARKIQETDLSDAVKQKLESNVTINNAPDDEDLEVDGNNHIKLADKPYTPSNNSGLGRYYVRKEDDVTVQGFFESGYRYIIQYKHDLDGESINIPVGCVLDFQGGMLVNGNMASMFGEIDAPNVQIFDDMTFDATKCNFDMNICWMGAKGDWYDGAATWTDNTDAIQAAFNTYLGIFIPAGKFACNNPITLNPQQSWNDDAKDSYLYVRGKCVRGAGQRNSWLVCAFNDSTKDFFTVRHLYGELTGIFVTSTTDGFANYGVKFCDSMANADVDIASYGNFEWAVCHNGMVQSSNMKLLVTNVPHAPHNSYPKRPNNGVKFADVPYFWMFKLDIRCEYVWRQGISITCTGGGLFDLKFMAEACSKIGSISTGTTSTKLHDSYTEARENTHYPSSEVEGNLVLDGCKNIEVDTMGNAHLEIIDSNVIVRRAIIHSVDADSFVQLDRCSWDVYADNIGDNIVWIGSRSYNDTNIARSGGSLSDNANPNLFSNIYDVSANSATLCGVGCSDTTHYDGYPHSIKVDGSVSGGSLTTQLLFSSQMIAQIGGCKWLIVSVVFKAVTGEDIVQLRMTVGHGYTAANTDHASYRDQWIQLADGWFKTIAAVKLDDDAERHTIDNNDWTISFYAKSKNTETWDDTKTYRENVAAGNVVNSTYYLTQIMAVSGSGASRSFKLKDGDDAYGNIRSGATANRPLFMPAGFRYFDTTLSCPIWADGIGGWVNGKGETV